MFRLVPHRPVWLAAILMALPVCAQAPPGDARDAIFSTIPFDQWEAQGDRAEVPWRTKISSPVLDEHQRFLVTATATIDGKNLAKRSSTKDDDLLMLLQIKDSRGHVYQGHTNVPLSEADDDVRHAEFVYTHSALVIPGDYEFTMAMLHRATGEHDFSRTSVHVAPLKNDPLPNLWERMTPAEILGKETQTEEWFHPDATDHVRLSVASKRAVRVEVIVNLPRTQAGDQFYRESMAALVARMKVLAQMSLTNGTVNITLLDVQHRRAVAVPVQDGAISWSELRVALDQSNPNVIDVHALEKPGEDADFATAEIRKRVRPNLEGDERRGDAAPVIIMLTAPGSVGRAGKPAAIEGSRDGKFFFLRYHPPMMTHLLPPAGAPPRISVLNSNDDVSSGRAGRLGGTIPDSDFGPGSLDDKTVPMHDLLKPLKPKIMDADSPEKFREALAAIIEGIGKM